MRYRIGLPVNEVSEEALKKASFTYKIVEPRKQMVQMVRRVIGKPYKRGASVLRDAPESFDCSSLIAWVAVEAGYSIPRIAIDQFVFSKRINKDDLNCGDFVFANTKEVIHTEGIYFSKVLGKDVKEESIRTETLEYMPGTKVPHGVDHVGIYVGDGKIIHATVKKGGVVEEVLGESEQFQNIVGYGRIIDNEEKRYVVDVPDDRPDLRNKETLIQELQKYDK
ncbi:MAG: C40 family peptidase [Minisyncoccota bacterium]